MLWPKICLSLSFIFFSFFQFLFSLLWCDEFCASCGWGGNGFCGFFSFLFPLSLSFMVVMGFVLVVGVVVMSFFFNGGDGGGW